MTPAEELAVTTPAAGPHVAVKRMAPGFTGNCDWNGQGGAFVVLRASLSGASEWLTPEQGAVMLADYYDAEPSVIAGQATPMTWRTVLAKECDDGFHDVGCGVEACEQGQFCSEGSGAKWAEVLGISHDAASPAAGGDGA